MKRSEINAIKSIVLSALITDGGHHKQAYLEELLALVTSEDEAKSLKNRYEW